MINKPKLVSIIVPIYNIDKYLDKCINSLLSQSYKNIEIILVNDGSTDNSGSICRKFVKRDKRIVLVEKLNGGLISARKSGLLISQGEFISYVDGDDWVEPEFILDLVSGLKNNFVDVVIANHKENLAGRIEILENQIKPGLYGTQRLKNFVWPRMLNFDKFSSFGIFSYVWGKLYKKSLLLNHQLIVDESIFIGEDAACLYPLLLNAKCISIISVARYHYRQRVDSLIKEIKSDEVYKIGIFYSFLRDIFLKSDINSILIYQLQIFSLSLLAVRSTGPHSFSNQILFPFGSYKNGDKIIILGAGTFGQHLFKRLTNIKKISIVGWIDELCDYYNLLGLKIRPLSDINSINYDYILVAYINQKVALNISSKLIKAGIDKGRIKMCIYYNKKNISNSLKEFKIV